MAAAAAGKTGCGLRRVFEDREAVAVKAIILIETLPNRTEIWRKKVKWGRYKIFMAVF